MQNQKSRHIILILRDPYQETRVFHLGCVAIYNAFAVFRTHNFRLAKVALREAQFERPPLLEALKERKEMMKSVPRYDMNQGGLLCDEPWFDLSHLSFVTSYVAWATLSATLHGLRCMGYVGSYIAWATLHGLRLAATFSSSCCFRNVDKKEPFAKLSGTRTNYMRTFSAKFSYSPYAPF